MNTTLEYPSLDDRRLVELHLAGDWSAFRQIVERYQALVCALAVSACGDVARSEDIAQEVFVAAWRQLPELREPAKLRAWLCGIARNLIHNAVRQQQRTPTARAEPLSPETPAEGGSPQEHAISSEESALMWRALEAIPGIYREPMVLYYREHCSMSAVAAALEISEEATRQRLVRGRALLSERMAKLVEETLERSGPTAAFSGAVLLALPSAFAPAMAATTVGTGAKSLVSVGGAAATAAKGGLALKVLSTVAALPMLLTGLTDYLRFRSDLATSDRKDVVRSHVRPLLGSAAVLGVVAFLILFTHFPDRHTVGFCFMVAVLVGVTAVLTARHHHKRGEKLGAAAGYEYRSSAGWLGLPWVHICAGGKGKRRVARGWIAISDGSAFGGLVAFGPLAIAPLSVGNVAVGLFSLGGIVAGVGALGGIAAGWWAAGGLAAGWEAAWGGIVAAHTYAVGGTVFAAQANTAAANAFIGGHWFFQLV